MPFPRMLRRFRQAHQSIDTETHIDFKRLLYTACPLPGRLQCSGIYARGSVTGFLIQVTSLEDCALALKVQSDRLTGNPTDCLRASAPGSSGSTSIRIQPYACRLTWCCVYMCVIVLAAQAGLWPTHEPANSGRGPRGINGVAASQSRPGFSTAAAPRCPRRRVAGKRL